MVVDMDEIRKEIAIKHGTLVGENDPVLMVATINEVVLRRYVEFLDSQNEANRKAIDGAIEQGIRVAKQTSGRIITEASGYVSDQVHTAVTAAMDEGREELRKDIRHAWNKVEEARKASIVWAALSGIFALISVVANYVF